MDNKCAFIIFGHSNIHTVGDINDMIKNISYFHSNCDFMINHPNIEHPKIRMRHSVGQLNHSNFIFGALIDLIKSLTEDEISNYEHFCLVSANQYFINNIRFDKGINYIQYYNTDNWDMTYKGKDTDKTIQGFPIIQPYGKWDAKNLFKEYGIKTPMPANWECMTITKETMLLAKQHLDKCLEYYPNDDMINIFLPYMAILSGQEWEFPPHFGTYDPSNPEPKNWVLTIPQIEQKRSAGYFSVKRVNYSADCPIKDYIRNTYMNDNN